MLAHREHSLNLINVTGSILIKSIELNRCTVVLGSRHVLESIKVLVHNDAQWPFAKSFVDSSD